LLGVLSVIDSYTLQSTPESDTRAGYDGAKRRKGSKIHIAVDTLGHLLALLVTPAAQGDRAQVEALAQDMQQVTGGTVETAYFAQAVLVRNLRLSQRRTGSS
jgi:Transposase DDE domain